MNRILLKITAIAIVFLSIANISNAQVNIEINKNDFKTSEKNGYKDALISIKIGDEYYVSNSVGGYSKALTEYLAANSYNSNNPELNYKIGVCYLYSTQKNKSISFLEKAYNLNNNVCFDIKYLIGRAYQINSNFKKAIEVYSEFKKTDYDAQIKKLKT